MSLNDTLTAQYFGNYLTSLISGVLSTGPCRPARVPNELQITLVLSCTVSDLQDVLCVPDPTPIQPQFLGCSPCTRSPMLGVNEHMGLSYLIVTDGQTDKQTDRRLTVASPRSALASRGKNYTNGAFQCQYGIKTLLKI